MKRLILFFCIAAFAVNSFAEKKEFISYYFHKSSLFALNSVPKVAPQLYGKYELSNRPENELRRAAGEFLHVDETGLYFKKNRLLNISRTEVRENSKYRVKDNYIYGVVEGDSLPVALDGEDYYFLVPTKTYLYESRGGANRLMQLTKTRYALFSFEDVGHYSVIVADFVNGTIDLKDVVISASGPNSVELVQNKTIDEELSQDYKTYILTPNKEDWKSIFSKCLKSYDSYSRVQE
ncbi:MAG: hypothetical protein ABJG68_08750 [Crocinitomicaceae bacterium]